MEYLQKEPRGQLTLYTTCLNDMVGYDNTVRAIDRFVDSLEMEKLGFAPGYSGDVGLFVTFGETLINYLHDLIE